MDFSQTLKYRSLISKLEAKCYEIKANDVVELKGYGESIFKSDLEDAYSKPMKWIGMYIALASLVCILLMVADLLHGLRNRKLWFPCKYFTINAASLTVIAVAMKLPVDLNSPMPGAVDQVAKLGSMAFMCTMMANLLPCLATMNTDDHLANVTALGVLVITLVVNVCIEIHTGVVLPSGKDITAIHDILDWTDVYDSEYLKAIGKIPVKPDVFSFCAIAGVYVAFLLFLLIIYVCLSLAILRSKQIIESKYQQQHDQTASEFVRQYPRNTLTVEELEQHVSNYWIMAGSGSPQFILACSAPTNASGVICALTFLLHAFTICLIIPDIRWTIGYMSLLSKDDMSDYKWSTLVILIVQFIGIVLGTVAPLSRCVASLSFKVTIESIKHAFWSHMEVFKIEEYWTHKLKEWKYGSISLPYFHNRKLKVVIKKLKNLILNFSLKLQEGVVVVCKIIALIPFFFTICLRCSALFCSCGKRRSDDQDLKQRKYVLHLHENENENIVAESESILEGLLKSFNRFIQKSEKKQPKNLIKLIIEKSTNGFQGVRKFDNNNNYDDDHRDCWSLAVVTLTTIAVTLPNVGKVEVKSLLKSVREGLQYVTIVEENLINATDDHKYQTIQKAAKTLWEEVDFLHKWLGIKLKDIESQVNKTACRVDDTKPQSIVQLFREKAENKISKIREKNCTSVVDQGKITSHMEGLDEYVSICANSMSRITRTIIDDYEESTHKKLFDDLSSKIADIMAACLANLPQVIAMKCHTGVIEKRQASVEAAAKLLGETKQIINTLQDPLQDKWRDCLSKIDPNDLPFIDKWRAYLSEP